MTDGRILKDKLLEEKIVKKLDETNKAYNLSSVGDLCFKFAIDNYNDCMKIVSLNPLESREMRADTCMFEYRNKLEKYAKYSVKYRQRII